MQTKTSLLAIIVLIAAGGANVSSFSQDRRLEDGQLAAASPLSDRHPSEAQVAPLTAGAAYDACVRGPWPSTDDASRRLQACDMALTTNLNAEQLALARLTKGVALAVNTPGVGSHRDTVTKRKRYNAALGEFDEVLSHQPYSVDALIARGYTYGVLGDRPQAYEDLEKALVETAGSPQALVVRGLMHNRDGEKTLATKDYDAALQRDPDYPQALANRAALLSEEGRYEEAGRDLDRAIEVAPDNAVAHYNRGYTHFARAQYSRALSDYDSAIRLDPALGVAYTNRCLVRAILADMAGAQEDCDTARLLMPDNLDVRETRGFLQLRKGDAGSALNEYEQVLTVDRRRPLALYGRGIARALLGDAQAGERDRSAALTIDPRAAREFTQYGIHWNAGSETSEVPAPPGSAGVTR